MLKNKSDSKHRDLTTSDTSTVEPNEAEIDTKVIDLFDFNTEKVQHLQRSNTKLSTIIRYLESNALPKGQKTATRILLESNDYVLVNGLSMRTMQQKSQRSKTKDSYLLVVPEVMIKEIIKLYHDNPMSWHSGINGTLDRLQENGIYCD